MSKIEIPNEVAVKLLLSLIAQNDNDQSNASPFIGKYVVVRTHSAGVHIGTLVSKNAQNAVLKDARRLYQWSGAFTLSTVANEGIQGGKMPAPVNEIELEGVIEVIPTSSKAEKCIREFKVHQI